MYREGTPPWVHLSPGTPSLPGYTPPSPGVHLPPPHPRVIRDFSRKSKKSAFSDSSIFEQEYPEKGVLYAEKNITQIGNALPGPKALCQLLLKSRPETSRVEERISQKCPGKRAKETLFLLFSGLTVPLHHFSELFPFYF